ncbi:MAG: hypothetical protein OHK0022_52650 [Roseiflexaceae bacterium]
MTYDTDHVWLKNNTDHDIGISVDKGPSVNSALDNAAGSDAVYTIKAGDTPQWRRDPRYDYTYYIYDPAGSTTAHTTGTVKTGVLVTYNAHGNVTLPPPPSDPDEDLFGVTPGMSPATPPVQPGVYYVIASQLNGKVLNIYGNSKTPDAPIIMWENDGGANEAFRFEPVGDGHYYYIVSKHSDLCVHAQTVRDESPITQWPRQGETEAALTRFRWRFEHAGDGFFYLVLQGGGGVLTIERALRDSGAKLVLYGNRRDLHQRWRFETPPSVPVSPSPVAGWQPWQGLSGGALGSSLALSARGSGRLDMFARGTGGNLVYRSFSGGNWSAWESLGGDIIGAPASASWGPDRIDCVVVGGNNQAWRRSWEGGRWLDWQSLGGGVITSSVALCSWAPGRLDLFARGPGGELLHGSIEGGTWFGWENLGGQIIGAPAAAAWGPGRLDCVVVGGNNQPWHRAWDGSRWTEWVSLGGGLDVAALALTSQGAGRLDMFANGPGTELLHRSFQDGRWGNWTNLGGTMQGAPAAASWGAGRLDCVVLGGNNQPWLRSLG